MANVERILKNERIFSFHPEYNNVLSGKRDASPQPTTKGCHHRVLKTFQGFGTNDPITIARNSLTPLSSPSSGEDASEPFS
jgi:hypothetical protein